MTPRTAKLLVVNSLVALALAAAAAPLLQANESTFGCCRTSTSGGHFCCDKNSCDCSDTADCTGDVDCKPIEI